MLPLPDSYEEVRSSVQLTLAARVGLRFPLSEDILLIQQWLQMADVELSWGKPEQNLALLASSRADVDHRVILVGDDPVGYLRWRKMCGPDLAGTSAEGLLSGGAVQLDVLVGPRDRRFVGIGSVALRAACEELAEATGAKVCFGRASVHHLALRRVYEKAGFLHHYFHADPEIGPVVIMVKRELR